MRHLGSLILGLAIAPVIWVVTSLGWAEFNGGLTDNAMGDTIVGLAVLLVAGILLAVLLLPRWSPIGTIAAGGLFLIMAIWAMIDLASLVKIMPDNFLGTPFGLSVPIGALSVLLAVPLLATVAVPHRWRSARPAPAPYYPGAPYYPAGASQPGYPPYPTGAVGPLPPGQFVPGAPVPPGGHPPNYGPSAAPSHVQSAPPNFGPSAPPNFGTPAPPNFGTSAPPHNVPSGPPYYGPPAGLGSHGRPPGAPSSGPPVPGAPTSVPPSLAPLPPAQPGRPRTDETTQFTGRPDETTQFTGSPDDDGTDGATRRIGDDTRPL